MNSKRSHCLNRFAEKITIRNDKSAFPVTSFHTAGTTTSGTFAYSVNRLSRTAAIEIRSSADQHVLKSEREWRCCNAGRLSLHSYTNGDDHGWRRQREGTC